MENNNFKPKKIIKIKCDKKLNPKTIDVIKDFLKFVQSKLNISNFPIINLHKIKQEGMTTGSYDIEENSIHCLIGHRLIVDILRTLAHELSHRSQHETGMLETELSKIDPLDEMGDLHTPYENEAYEKAGNIVKEFCRRQNVVSKDELYSLHQ